MTYLEEKTLDKTVDKRLQNLRPKPWKPGQSGNLNGRPPKELSLTDGLREYVNEKDLDKKRERKDMLVEKIYQMALRGDIGAIKEIWNRLEGLPKGSETIVPIQINNFTPQDVKDGAMMWIENNQEDTANKLRELAWKVEK